MSGYTAPAAPNGGGHLIAELPDHERPRERFASLGAEALSDAELLAILLRTGARGRSALDLGRDLLGVFGGSLARLAAASIGELCQVPGIGTAKATEVRSAFALATRLARHVEAGPVRIESPTNVADLLREPFRLAKQEEFHVLMLDTKNQLLRDQRATIGLLDRSQVHPREVFREAIREGCARVVLAHNHPSGDPTPSAQDIASTRNLVDAGKVVGIEVLDHIVVGRRAVGRNHEYVSFREHGLLDPPTVR